MTTGTLPTGLSLGATTGALIGTPSASGSFGFTVTVTDSDGATGSQAYTVAIANAAITVTPATLPGGTNGPA